MAADEGVTDGQNPAGGANEGTPNPDAGGQPKPGERPNPDPQRGKPSGTEDVETLRRGFTADIQNERRARQKAEQQIQALQTQLQDSMKRVQALAGVAPKDEAADEAELIRQKLQQLVPGMKILGDEQGLQRLERLINSAEALENMVYQQHSRQGLNTFKGIESAIAKEYGELSEKQVKQIRAAYVFEVETNQNFAARHENDPESQIAEFAKEWLDNWYEPAKRRVIASEVNRQRRVPGARDRGSVNVGREQRVDVNDPKAVEDVLVAGFRDRGGEFGRRR